MNLKLRINNNKWLLIIILIIALVWGVLYLNKQYNFDILITLQFILIVSTILYSFNSHSEAKKSNDLSRRLLEQELTDPMKAIQIVENDDTKSELSLVQEKESSNLNSERKWVVYTKNINNYKTVDKIKINYLKILRDYEPVRSFYHFQHFSNDKNGFQKAEYVMYPDSNDANGYRIRICIRFDGSDDIDKYIKNGTSNPFLVEMELETISINGLKSKYLLSIFCNQFCINHDADGKTVSKVKWSYSKSVNS